MDESSKKILLEIFGILGFSEEEQEKALLDFKKKIAAELLRSAFGTLPQDEQKFIEEHGSDTAEPQSPMMAKIRETLRNLKGLADYKAQGKKILAGLLPEYIAYMSEGLSAEDTDRLNECAKKLAA